MYDWKVAFCSAKGDKVATQHIIVKIVKNEANEFNSSTWYYLAARNFTEPAYGTRTGLADVAL